MTPPTTRRTPSAQGRSGLSADLLADLNAPGALPTSTPPSAGGSSRETTRGTPALSLTVTPLRWRQPSFQPPERGTGVAVRLGPLRVELAL
jgi:hypothetical protein